MIKNMYFFFALLLTKLTDDQKCGMIEPIAILIHHDYDVVVLDFVKLGFIPEGVSLDPTLPVLAKVFYQGLEGGNANNINFRRPQQSYISEDKTNNINQILCS